MQVHDHGSQVVSADNAGYIDMSSWSVHCIQLSYNLSVVMLKTSLSGEGQDWPCTYLANASTPFNVYYELSCRRHLQSSYNASAEVAGTATALSAYSGNWRQAAFAQFGGLEGEQPQEEPENAPGPGV